MAEWKYDICGCFNNCGLCILTYFVPCWTAGRNAEGVGKSCCLYGFLSILGPLGVYARAKIRGKIREQKGIEGGFLMDCILHCCVPACALIQEAQELEEQCGAAMAQE